MWWILACQHPADVDPKGLADSPRVESRADGDSTESPAVDSDPNESVPSTEHPRLLLLVVDGLRVEEFTSSWVSDLTGVTGEQWAPRTWAELAPKGTLVRSILSAGPTFTAPAHAAILAGRNLPYSNLGSPGYSTLYRPELPTLMQTTERDCGPTRYLGNATLLWDTGGSLYPGMEDPGTYDGTYHADEQVLRAVVNFARDEDPCLIVANLHDVDREGHDGTSGHYAAQVQTVDGALANFWTNLELEAPAWAREALVIITSDHGRHRGNLVQPPWMEHGDACAGCREVPLLMIGPGVPAGVVEEQRSWTLSDLSLVMAGWLGVSLPYTIGLDPGILPDLHLSSRSGSTGLVQSGSLTGELRWLAEETRRNEVRVNGELLSSPDAFAVRALSLTESAGSRWACWRELKMAGQERWPWVPRCMHQQEGVWTDIGFPVDEVGPTAETASWSSGNTLWVAWPDNGFTDSGTWYEDLLRVATWTEADGWKEVEEFTGFSFMHPSLWASGQDYRLLVALSGDQQDARSSRGLWLLGPGISSELDFSSVLGQEHRVERGAFRLDGNAIVVGAIGISNSGTHLLRIRSADGGRSFGAAEEIVSPWPPMPHLSPRWQGSRLVWAVAMSEDEAGFCAIDEAETLPTCVSVGMPYVDAFSVEASGLTVSASGEDRSWTPIFLSL
jgi:Sulfatase